MRLQIAISTIFAFWLVQAQSPFYYSFDNSTTDYEFTGKMEQNGRTGVAAMHAVLLNEKSILIIDKAEENEAKLDSGVSAYSTLYDIETNTFRTLELETNTFCSAGGFLANGTFISTGGAESRSRWNAQRGHQSIRHFMDGEWHEYGKMYADRWYPTVEQLPEGDLIIIGGSIAGTKWNTKEKNTPSYEFWPPRTSEAITLDLLLHTLPYNLYPFVFLLPDGNLFIFASTKSIIYDYKKHKVVKELPKLPGVPRSYPLTGGAVMLPLDPAKDYQVEIIICGGSHRPRRDSPADDTCGRINLSDKNPKWEMDTFIHKRVMPDGVITADGNVLWINGCQRGYAGYNNANHDPTFNPLIYVPDKPHGQRWKQGLAATDIARMYHSVALALPDGRVWIAGSNSVDPPDIYAEYPTEYRVEYFSPPYLFKTRPQISHVPRVVEYNTTFNIQFHLEQPDIDPSKLRVAIMRPGFSTHSMHMSQRYVYLIHQFHNDSIKVTAPPHPNIFPPGSGYLVVVYDGIPSKGAEMFIERDINDLQILGVYAPGNVKLHPELLGKHQAYVQEKLKTDDDKPVYFVFHGGSGSSRQEIDTALKNGVVKMNVDTDTQWAYWKGLKDFYEKNKDYLQSQVGNPEGPNKPNKKYYDPRVFIRASEQAMIDRIVDALDWLNNKNVL